jgi:hypothetical protein
VTALETVDPSLVRPPGLRWWREVLYILAFYGIYTVVRDTQGSAGQGFTAKGSVTAFHHARLVIRIERDLRVFQEQHIQHVFAGAGHLFFEFWNAYYGAAHFVLTAAAIIWLFNRQPGRYPYWRNVLAITTALALVGFAAFPLMPPRLLDQAMVLHPNIHYGFIDTLAHYGGSWSFDSGAMQKVSNQYAAMPSLHFAWSSFCMLVFFPACKRWWTKALAVLYPLATLFAIIVTANHYFLDAVGGALVLTLGMIIARPVTTWMYDR